MITVDQKGSFDNTERFLKAMQRGDITPILQRYGRVGVNALANATPAESGQAAASWGFEIREKGSSAELIFTNYDTIDGGIPVVILLQYGHGTGTGGYVQGRDFINPTLRPIFDQISQDIWKAVTSA